MSHITMRSKKGKNENDIMLAFHLSIFIPTTQYCLNDMKISTQDKS